MKRDRPAKPGPIGRIKRSVYSRDRDPERARIVVSGGEIVGWEMSDGRFVAANGGCCLDPARCEREECWAAWPLRPQPPWWLR
jgi:hypothetical protein